MSEHRYKPTFHFHESDICAPVTLETYAAGTWEVDGHMERPCASDVHKYTMYTNQRTVVLDDVTYIDLLYMVLYPFNKGPTVLGKRVGDHAGDLEHVRILVNARTERIERVYFGGHSGGYWKQLRECAVVGGSVQVYSAVGTHANYHRAGTQWRVPPVLKDVTSDRGVAWSPAVFVQAPTLTENIAAKVPAFHNQRWWHDVPAYRQSCWPKWLPTW
jgi:hypothetical protein